MATTTFNVNGQPLCTVEIAPLGKDVLERASKNLRKEHSRKFIPGEMDFEDLAEFGAECARLVIESLTMADGTRPLLGKPPEAARKFLRLREHEKLVGAIAKLAKALDETEKDEVEVTSGN
jgi:hypothetical protein